MTEPFKLQTDTISGLKCWRITANEDIDLFKHTLSTLLPFYKNMFPGPLPVSLTKDLIVDSLKQKTYYVCEKNDGERLCCIFARVKGLKVCFGLDRKGEIYILPPCRNIVSEVYNGTVYDCEISVNQDAQDKRPVITVFDCLAKTGYNIEHKTFSERMMSAQVSLYSYKPCKDDKFRMQVKPVFRLCSKGWGQFMEHYFETKEVNNIDGMIFIPETDEVVYGRHANMYKWKEPLNNTIDFIIHGRELSVYSKGRNVPVSSVSMTCGIPQGVRDGSVVECKYNADDDSWSIVKMRTDKLRSNDIHTYRATLHTIRENITLKSLHSMLV
jgi:mRNA capping enzyme, catalytic domain/mRNA capping enzyme, C-terminal domain